MKINKQGLIKGILRESIMNSNYIAIGVSYITSKGLDEIFKGIDVSNKEIYIITTNDDGITNQSSIDYMNNLGAKVRIINKEINKQGFHAKFVYFKGKRNVAYSGSFNITKESFDGKIENIIESSFEETKEIFESLWDSATPAENISFACDNKFIDTIINSDIKDIEIKLNPMQKKAMDEINDLLEKKEKKFLLWAATGTGKTILSMLFRERINSSKTLFIVHQNKIIESAMNDYKRFRPSLNIIKYSQDININNAYDVIFITDKSARKLLDINKDFLRNFESVIFDECHHIGPETYQEELFDFFVRENKYIFGMTATIRRTDKPLYLLMKFEGKENVVGKVTMDLALKEKIIIPMKYYIANGDDENLTKDNDIIFNLNKSLDYIKKLNTSDNGKPKILFFVDTINNAEIVSRELNNKGIESISINSNVTKNISLEKIISRLSNEADNLQSLVTINMFNEGVDIPCVNTIVMLRKTKSEIIYTQQIGRGLRKFNNKTHLNVIDVVKNNEMDFNRYVSLFGLEKEMGPMETLKKLLSYINKEENLIEGDPTKNHNEFFIEKMSSKDIVKLLSEKNMDIKFLNSFNKKIFDHIIHEEKLNLFDAEELLNESINIIANTFKSDVKYKFKVSNPWVVEFFKEYMQLFRRDLDINKITTNEKVLIELMSWMPITSSTINEKRKVLELLNGREVELNRTWLSYFVGYNIKENSLIRFFMPPYKDNMEYFTKVNDNKLLLNLNSLSKEATFFINEIKRYLISNMRNDKFKFKAWYSLSEVSFMMGYVNIYQGGEFRPSTLYENREEIKEYAINSIVTDNKSGRKNIYNNFIKNDSEIIFARTKRNSKIDYSPDEVIRLFVRSNNGVAKKIFSNPKMLIYLGESSIDENNLRPIENNGEFNQYKFTLKDKLPVEERFLLEN